MQLVGERDIFTNQFIEKPEEYKAPLVAMMKARSPQCFDHGFYRDANWDLNKDLSKDQSKPIPDEQLWHHFIHSGQFEARPHRCVSHYYRFRSDPNANFCQEKLPVEKNLYSQRTWQEYCAI